jgi:hypothetical protein
VTRPKKQIVSLSEPIHPDQFYRTILSRAIWGIEWQAVQNKVRAGELPPPFGNPAGWLGSQILEHRADQQKRAAEKLEARRNAEKQPQPKAFQKKIKKVKLRAPSRGAASA